MMVSDVQVRDRLRRYVAFLRKQDPIAQFLKSISRFGEPFLFGGAARDVAFFGRRAVNDLDVFVCGSINESALLKSDSFVRRNRFGGYRLVVGSYEVDIWELHKSLAFRCASESFISVESLLKTVCFTTDAIAVSLLGPRVIRSRDFDWSASTGVMGFVAPPMSLDRLVAARIARVSLKLGLDLSPALASYFERCVEEYGTSGIVDAEARWGDKRFLTEISIQEVRAKILASMDRAIARMSGDSRPQGTAGEPGVVGVAKQSRRFSLALPR